MLLLIILGLIAVVSITIGILIDKYDYENGASVVFGVIGVLALIGVFVATISLANIDRRFDAQINQYEAISAMVESYDGQDYGNMQALTKEVIYINAVIAKHKAFYGNRWTGAWYSEDIAKLEPIKFGKKTVPKE